MDYQALRFCCGQCDTPTLRFNRRPVHGEFGAILTIRASGVTGHIYNCAFFVRVWFIPPEDCFGIELMIHILVRFYSATGVLDAFESPVLGS